MTLMSLHHTWYLSGCFIAPSLPPGLVSLRSPRGLAIRRRHRIAQRGVLACWCHEALVDTEAKGVSNKLGLAGKSRYFCNASVTVACCALCPPSWSQRE